MIDAPRRWGPIAVMAVWLTILGAATLFALSRLARAALEGDLAQVVIVLLFIGSAAYEFHAALRRMQALLGIVRKPKRLDPAAPRPARVWRDGMGGKGEG